MNATQIAAKLADPFPASEIKFKPQTVRGDKALAIFYLDARHIMDRFDDVVGFNNWQDEYKLLPDGQVECTLRVRIDGEWISKTDVGGESEQPDSGDRMKAAYSDALKRAAVKFGIGRYLYRLPMQWLDYDSQKKRFIGKPKLPAFAVPANTGNPQPHPDYADDEASVKPTKTAGVTGVTVKSAKPATMVEVPSLEAETITDDHVIAICHARGKSWTEICGQLSKIGITPPASGQLADLDTTARYKLVEFHHENPPRRKATA